jgi:hypothetical protein
MTSIVNLKYDTYDVYIGRGSIWGNPFSHKNDTKALFKVKSRKDALNCYKEWILNGEGQFLLDHLNDIEGKILGCYCKPMNCHGDILVEIINNRNKSII